jgi:hypothetical protein
MAEMRIMLPRSIILHGLHGLRYPVDHLPSMFPFDTPLNPWVPSSGKSQVLKPIMIKGTNCVKPETETASHISH